MLREKTFSEHAYQDPSVSLQLLSQQYLQTITSYK